MIDTTLSISGIEVHEPVTVFTNFIITTLLISFYCRLKLLSKSKGDGVNEWRLFFLFLAISSFLGGCSHAFFLTHESLPYKSVWLSNQLMNGISVYFAQQATFATVLKNSINKNKWKWSYLIQLLVFGAALLLIQNYLVTVFENAIGLIPVMVLHYSFKPKTPSYIKIANGIAIAFVSAIVFVTKFSIHRYFNFNDLAHLFIMASVYTMYKGIKEYAVLT
ncbi:MAG: hypothetical protein ABI315_11450 [Bacteroidia bacterium]